MRSFAFIELTKQQHSFMSQASLDYCVNSVTPWGFYILFCFLAVFWGGVVCFVF